MKILPVNYNLGNKIQKAKKLIPLAMLSSLAVVPSCNIKDKPFSEYSKDEANRLFREAHANQNKYNVVYAPYAKNCPCSSCDSVREEVKEDSIYEAQKQKIYEERHFKRMAKDFLLFAPFKDFEQETFVNIASKLKLNNVNGFSIGRESEVSRHIFDKNNAQHDVYLTRIRKNVIAGIDKKTPDNGKNEYYIFKSEQIKGNDSNKIQITKMQISPNNSVENYSEFQNDIFKAVPELYETNTPVEVNDFIDKFNKIDKFLTKAHSKGKSTTVFSFDKATYDVSVEFVK